MLKLSSAIIEKFNAGNVHVQELWEFFKRPRQHNDSTPQLKKNGSLVNDGMGKSDIFVDKFK